MRVHDQFSTYTSSVDKVDHFMTVNFVSKLNVKREFLGILEHGFVNSCNFLNDFSLL